MSDEKWVPEVGEKCEIKRSDRLTPVWQEARVLAVGERMALVVVGKAEIACRQSNMRPIKTEAERKREKDIDEMRLCFRGRGWQLSESKEKEICNAILDSGYRKVNNLTHE